MNNLIKKIFKDSHRAQSASELAIFGAILIFVIGLIIRAGVGASQNMNAQLRAMRFALSESYRTGEGQYSEGKSSSARNFASILLVEDRLSVDVSDKMQSRDRVPLIAAASGAFSRNLFLTTDFKEDWSMPIYDVIINGQRFPFITSGFRTIEFWTPEHTPAPNPPTDGTVVIDLRNYRCVGTGVNAHPPNPASGKKRSGICWQADCIDGPSGSIGCPMFYKVVGNYPNSEDWKNCSPVNATCDYRFDLKLDGGADVQDSPIDTVTGKSPRLHFAWQWVKVAGVVNGTAISAALQQDSDGGKPYIKGIDPNVENPTNNMANVDKHPSDEKSAWEEETIFNMKADDNGVIYRLGILDSKMGDVNFSDTEDPPGLKDDLQMYSFSSSGTTFQVEEGKVVKSVGTARFARSTNRQEHMDIIQRVFKLSRDSGRFCNPDGSWRNWGDPDKGPVDPPPGVSGMKNPVEACNNCLGDANRQKTCMDQGDRNKDGDEVIFIRSRVKDLRGRRWVTRLR